MRAETGKPGGQDLRAIAETIHERARPGDAFLLGDTGTVTLRPRVALAAYPASFAGLDDIALVASYASTGTYSDVLLDDDALPGALAAVRRIWVVLPASGADADGLLAEAGFSRIDESRVPTTTIALWERRPLS
jgi:mannosyltransferase